MQPGLLYGALLCYALIGFIVAFWSRGRLTASVNDYFLANRMLGGAVAALTYSATTYSAFMMVGLAGLVYRGGVGALGFELVYLAGLVLAAVFGPRFWLVGKKYNYLSPNEMLSDRYQSRWVGFVFTIFSAFFLIPYAAVQLMGIGYLLQGLSGNAIPFLAGVTVAVILALAWSLVAGLRSVAWTDSLQALIMLITSLAVVGAVIYTAWGGVPAFLQALEKICPEYLTVPGPGYFSFATFVNLTLPWFFFSISNPQVSQRYFVTRSIGAQRQMLRGFLVFGFIYTIVSVCWGFAARLLLPGLKNPDLATPSLLASPYVPPLLALLALIGITAAAISTLDSIMLTLSSMIARDVAKTLRPSLTEKSELLIGKLLLPVLAGLAFLFALRRVDLIAVLAVTSSLGLMVIVPSMWGAFFWPKATAAGALSSIMAGAVVAIYMHVNQLKIAGFGPALWTLIISFAVFVFVSLLTRPPEKKAEEFLGYLRAELAQRNII